MAERRGVLYGRFVGEPMYLGSDYIMFLYEDEIAEALATCRPPGG